MYLQFFDFKEEPFSVTPNPKFLYLAPQHHSALETLKYGIEARKGFLMLTSEIGTGKTTICRALLERVNSKTDVAVLLNPLMSVPGLIQAINEDFGNKIKILTLEAQLKGLNDFLLSRLKKGRNAVVLVDEAQNLSIKALEMIRLLSNLETNTEKLLQIILVGQPELESKMASYDLRQLAQRITFKCRLGPLDLNETQGYILHRLNIAGGAGKLVFHKRVFKKIFKHTGGYPRLLNMLCDRILLEAYARQVRLIDITVVRAAVKDANQTQQVIVG
jgi:general secretion pathway protein A